MTIAITKEVEAGEDIVKGQTTRQENWHTERNLSRRMSSSSYPRYSQGIAKNGL